MILEAILNELNLGLNYCRTKLKLENSFQSYKISTFNYGFLGSVKLQLPLITISLD